jgi:hypothetical protein
MRCLPNQGKALLSHGRSALLQSIEQSFLYTKPGQCGNGSLDLADQFLSAGRYDNTVGGLSSQGLRSSTDKLGIVVLAFALQLGG